MDNDSEKILLDYINKYGFTIVSDNEAEKLFKNNMEKFEHICGENIYLTLEDFFIENDDDDGRTLKFILINKNNEPTSIFGGEIDGDKLESSYTCSSEIPKGGILLRFYALLKANKLDDNVTKLVGGISGSIPPIDYDNDSDEIIERKKQKLFDYHIKNGATVIGNNFEYNIEEVKKRIPELFGEHNNYGGKKRKTSKNRRNKKSKKTKKRSLYNKNRRH